MLTLVMLLRHGPTSALTEHTHWSGRAYPTLAMVMTAFGNDMPQGSCLSIPFYRSLIALADGTISFG